jgi:hypothetical protein
MKTVTIIILVSNLIVFMISICHLDICNANWVQYQTYIFIVLHLSNLLLLVLEFIFSHLPSTMQQYQDFKLNLLMSLHYMF